MAEKLLLDDLVDSLAISRGKTQFQERTPEMDAVAFRSADSLEMAIFDEIVRERIRAKKNKFSFPGGPDETHMGKPFPMQSLERHEDPLEEILGIKVDAMQRQFEGRERSRALIRAEQRGK